VAAARAGDRAALDALLRRHHDRLWRLCRRLTGNDHDAADALQEALIAVARGIRRFDGRAAFTTWAYRVTTNACLDELRRRRRRPVPDALGAGGPGDEAWSDPIERIDGGRARGEAGRGPLGGAGGRAAGGAVHGDIEAVVADRLEVDEAVARLTPEFRAAVVLRDLCDLDYAEIARILDIPPGTVRSRIARGRGQLADLLGNRADPSERPTPAP